MDCAPISLTFEQSEEPTDMKLEIIKEEPNNRVEEAGEQDDNGVLSSFDISTKDQIPNDGTLEHGSNMQETERNKTRLMRSIFELSPRTPQLL